MYTGLQRQGPINCVDIARSTWAPQEWRAHLAFKAPPSRTRSFVGFLQPLMGLRRLPPRAHFVSKSRRPPGLRANLFWTTSSSQTTTSGWPCHHRCRRRAALHSTSLRAAAGALPGLQSPGVERTARAAPLGQSSAGWHPSQRHGRILGKDMGRTATAICLAKVGDAGADLRGWPCCSGWI